MHAAGPNNPLHGITLEKMVTDLQAYYGWEGLGERIRVNSFHFNPSIKSSLTFLRKTPWARDKVEGLYLDTLQIWARERAREEQREAEEGASPTPDAGSPTEGD